MAVDDVHTVVKVEAELDALVGATASQVWRQTSVYETDAVAAVAAQRALAGSEAATTQVFNVMDPDYGAVGDGVTNDKAAITAANAAASAAGGGTVFFPGGRVYAITLSGGGVAQFNIGGGVRWQGGYNATLQAKTGSGTFNTFVNMAGSDCRVEDLTFDANSIAETYGVSFGTNGLRNRVTGCKFTDCTIGVLINVTGVYDASVDHNFFDCTVGGYGFLCNFLSGTPAGGRWNISDNIVRGPGAGLGGEGIELNCPAAGAVCNDVIVSGNTVSNFNNTSLTGLGIGMAHARNVKVVGNTVSDCGQSGIHIEDGSQEIIIMGNTVHDCWGPAIEVISGAANGACDDSIIANNTITSCATGEGVSTSAGIRISSAGPLSRNWIVCGNRLDDCGLSSVSPQSGMYFFKTDNLLCYGNQISDVVGSGTRGGISLAGDHTVGASQSVFGNKISGCSVGMRFLGAHVYTFVYGNDVSGNTAPWASTATGSVYFWANGLSDVTKTTLTYSASITPNVDSARYFTVAATNTTAYSINNPTDGPMHTGALITFDIKNSSGGAMGAITWGNKFLLAGSFTNPADTKRRTIQFVWDGTNYVETNRAAADI